jgi:hypothetical protein
VRNALWPGGSSRISRAASSISASTESSGKSTPELQKTCRSTRTATANGVVCGDATNARADGECHLDHLVKSRLVAGRAQAASVDVVVDGLEAGVGAEHTAAAGAKYVPRHLEDAETRGVQEGGNGVVLGEAPPPGEVKDVDAVEFAVVCRRATSALHRRDDLRFRCAAQDRETGTRFRSWRRIIQDFRLRRCFRVSDNFGRKSPRIRLLTGGDGDAVGDLIARMQDDDFARGEAVDDLGEACRCDGR